MGTITKQDAAILFAYSFKLVDKEGKEYEITGIPEESQFNLTSYDDDFGKEYTIIGIDQIGTDYWILKRPYSQLVETIQHEGKEIVPMDESVKKVGHSYSHLNEKGLETARQLFVRDFPIGKLPHPYYDVLYSLHFIDLPEGTYKLIE